ncbi:hypothetical protein A1A1_15498 [Planococcus antarcticus DSM 14505]|uniref:Uncharacterized protein n=1 Tax=Planococcus antarcticus DSM 14505 TaxID=1185653 RepID=A0A1C7DCC1_9BACL|nr:hypothetical protein [Planococcus antarcticus]ANU09067.1 hypothetical protein BBH88_01330 [Planococcus antarcticus DSM 14505]EIM05572.1 hypothetical protein A1A1_15498 [Planococcus antarcticus DSM 14505]
MKCQITVTDFTEQGTAIYIKIEVYDHQKKHRHQEELRFLGDLLYGDLVHPKKSPLSEECRLDTIAYLKQYFKSIG